MLDLDSWIQRVRGAADRSTSHFEERFGYPPDHNRIIAAPIQSHIDLRRSLDVEVPSTVVEFFDAVAEVSLPDVWNGYFLGPVERVIDAYASESPRYLDLQGKVHPVLVIGSDGGGSLFCVSTREPGPVFRLVEPSIAGGVARTPPGFTRQLAPDFPGFLDAFAVAIESTARGETPAF